MLLAIHRITRDLEADVASSSEWNNCHASDVDSETDSIVFLRISELRSETDETLPRPHVSPPVPPHKLGKKYTSQILLTVPKVTIGDPTHEDLEENGRVNEQKELKTEHLTNGETSQKAEEGNGEKEKGEEKNRKERTEERVWKENEEEGELELKESAKEYALFLLTTEPSNQKAEFVGSELRRFDETSQVAGLGEEDYIIRRIEGEPLLLLRIGQKESAERFYDTQEESRETMNPSERSEGNDLSTQALPQLIRRWAYQASLEKSNKFFGFVVDERSSPQESQNKPGSVDETFIQFSKTEYGPSETQSECETVGQKCVAERPLNEHSKHVVRHRSKRMNARRLRKRIKHLRVPQNASECLQEQRDKWKMRHKFRRHLRAGEETDEEAIAEDRTFRGRAMRSRSRRRGKQCKSKDRQQYRKGVNLRRMVSEVGDESEILPFTIGKDVVIWKCKKSPRRRKKNKCFSPTDSKKLAMRTKKLIANMFRTVQEAVIPIECKNLTINVPKMADPSSRHKREEVKRSLQVHAKHGLDRNNNAVNGKRDVKSKPSRSETTCDTSPAVVAREDGCEPFCSHQGASRPRRSIMTLHSMGGAVGFSWYPNPVTKFSKSPEPLSSFYSWFEPSAPSPCVIQSRLTPTSVDSVPVNCKSQEKAKFVHSKLHKLKRRRLLRRSSGFKEQLEKCSKKGRPHELENLLSIIIDKYGFDLREYVQYLQVLRDRNNANRSWHLSIGQNKWGQWTQKEANEFEEFVCFISIDTADIDDAVLPFRVSITRHKLIVRAFKLYRQSLQMSQGTSYSFVDHKDSWVNAPFASFLWLKMCQLPADHPIRCMLRSSSGPQDRRIFAIENDIDGRILLSEDKVIFVRGLPCFQVHILAPTSMAIRFALMQMEQRLPSLYAKLVITERLSMVHSKWGDRSVQAPTMGNFTTRFNSSPHLAPRTTVIHAPLSATPEDRRDFASCCVNEDDPELEQIKMSQKFVDKLCTY
ncbi:hypothetical protein TSMEX_003347 [Taenia solium]|eukprot:TsM_001080300 transcript=TsM_001080300 gene=TsM_001080300